MIEAVLAAYGFQPGQTIAQPFGKGLINHTWKVSSGSRNYILQRINEIVFKRPADIAENIRTIKDHLSHHHSAYQFTAPISTLEGNELLHLKGHGYYRLFEFVEGSHSKDVVKTPGQAYEAALQFGRFTRLLSGLDPKKLKITIPDFHNLSFRFEQFEDALENGSQLRINQSSELISLVFTNASIVKTYEKIKTDPEFHLRTTHHDTKISNVLFDDRDKGMCVIDLDTVMPGYFISDVGDMMRTYLSPVSEEEKDLSKIEVRDDFYKSIVQGYMVEMKKELTQTEKLHFFYSGQFMIYMQAVRFLTDHINNDIYYGADYPDHNLVRASNQLTLLLRLNEKQDLLG